MTTLAVVIPAHAREQRLDRLLQALSRQARMPDEVIIARNPVAAGDPLPEDIACDKWGFPVRQVPNLIQSIPAALNNAIQSAESDLIVRLDARSVPDIHYLQRCEDTLANTGAQVVGGRWEMQQEEQTITARAIAVAVAHPMSTGGVRYRRQGAAAPGLVDTVPYGCFRRSLWKKLDGFDETLLSSEDYEFFWRVRARGGRIFFDPSICSVYFPRASYRGLMRQYFRYGWWKTQMLRKHPASIRARQLLPIAASAALVAALVFSAFGPPGRLMFGAIGLLYGGLLMGASVQQAVRARCAGLLVMLPVTFVSIHLSWCGGVWANLLGKVILRAWLTKTYQPEGTT